MIPFICRIYNVAQMSLSTEQKQTHRENRFVVAKREGKGRGGTGNLGLIDANYSLWNG